MGQIILLILVLTLLAIIFLICRKLINWYFRTNEIVELLKSIDKKLKE